MRKNITFQHGKKILLFFGSPLSTFKDVVFTQDSIKARSALAHKTVDVVPADGTVPAGLAGALIYLSLTALPFKTRAAVAGEAPNIVHTGASIQAWVCRMDKREGREPNILYKKQTLNKQFIPVINVQSTCNLKLLS